MDLERWLQKTIQTDNYYHLFVSNGFDSLDMIKNINNIETLEQIGISKIGHRLQLFKAIKSLQKCGLSTNIGLANEEHNQYTKTNKLEHGISTNICGRNIHLNVMNKNQFHSSNNYGGSNLMESIAGIHNINEYKNTMKNSIEETARKVMNLSWDQINSMPLEIQHIIKAAKDTISTSELIDNMDNGTLCNQYNDDIYPNNDTENEKYGHGSNDISYLDQSQRNNGLLDGNQNTFNHNEYETMPNIEAPTSFAYQSSIIHGGLDFINDLRNIPNNNNDEEIAIQRSNNMGLSQSVF